MRFLRFLLVALLLAAVVAAGCGGGGDDEASRPTRSPSSATHDHEERVRRPDRRREARRYKAQKTRVPEGGHAASTQTLKDQAMT